MHGKIYVDIIDGEFTKNLRTFSKMSPYVRIMLHENKFYESVIIKDGGLNPTFNDNCRLSLTYPDPKKIEITVYDYQEPLCWCCSKDQDDENQHVIGEGEFNLAPLLKEENFEQTNDVDLELDDMPRGTVRIKVRYEQDDEGLQRYLDKEAENKRISDLNRQCIEKFKQNFKYTIEEHINGKKVWVKKPTLNPQDTLVTQDNVAETPVEEPQE